MASLKTLWVATFSVILIWSGIEPKEKLTWLLEVSPAIFAIIALAYTYNSFRLTNLLYIAILVHCIILMIGGHYTYAEVPLFDYLQEALNSSRNNYDKLGHFAQGFTPALLAREIVLRKSIINGKNWQRFFIISFCVAFSAFYELIEWWVSITLGAEDSQSFLGTQGYIWDTQSDILMALIGATMAIFIFSKLHDKELKKLNSIHLAA